MALIYDAELTPGKTEILRGWVPAQSWFPGSELTVIGAFRFDDPAGEVGLETHLVRSGGRDFQVPLTYRGAPFEGGALIATMEHSVLGHRWVYDGCTDPVYAAALAAAIATGGRQADLELADGGSQPAPVVQVRGSGLPGPTPQRADDGAPGLAAAGLAAPGLAAPGLVTPAFVTAETGDDATVISAPGLRLTVFRVLDADRVADGPHLAGTWPGQTAPATLATLTAPTPLG